MLALKVPKRNAQETLAELLRGGALARGVKIRRDERFVYFPLSKRVSMRGYPVVAARFEEHNAPRSLREALQGKLSEAELEELVASFDTVGSIAILEIRPALRAKGRLIANALMRTHSQIKTVLRKDSAMAGKYRVRQFKWLAGRHTTEALYRESGCTMRVDLARDYFSPRLATERLRIAKLAKKGERVLALFAGVGPYALVIARNSRCAKAVAIELNPHACRLARENVKLNKLENRVEIVQGDVKKIVPKKYAKWANRITMPLPQTGEDFLEAALAGAADGCTVHYYAFAPIDGLYSGVSRVIRKKCAAAGLQCRIVNKRVVRPYAPKVSQVAVDFRVRRNK